VIEVEHQSFVLAYKGEDKKDAEWMASMLRIALEKFGARFSPANVKVRHGGESGCQSEAKEGRCPPLPLPSCSFSSSYVEGDS
jgi:hypothetical protein